MLYRFPLSLADSRRSLVRPNLNINFNSSFSNLSMTETNFPLNKSRLYCALIFFDANLFKFRWQAIRDICLSGRDLIVSHINHAWLDTTGFFTHVHTREVGVSGSPMCNLRAMCSIGEGWFQLSSWIFKTKESWREKDCDHSPIGNVPIVSFTPAWSPHRCLLAFCRVLDCYLKTFTQDLL